MPRSKLEHADLLVMKVRELLKAIEPHDMPTEVRKNGYGFDCWVCPYCGELCHMRVSYPRGSEKRSYGQYNMHFAGNHGTPFWKELELIKLLAK